MRTLAMVALASLAVTAVTVGVIKTQGSDSAGGGKADSGGNTAQGEPVVVQLRAEGLPEVHLKIGARELMASPTLETKLNAGTHAVQWRATLDGDWQDGGEIVLEAGRAYVVDIGEDGVHLQEKS